MGKKTAIITVVVIIAVFFVLRGLSPEDSWICVKGNWVKHGNPSALAPKTGCGDIVAVVDFEMTGHLTKDNPGLKPGVWYFVYEKPGSPALYKELVFDERSICAFNKKRGVCPDVLLPSSALTHIRGMSRGDTILVVEAFTGAE